MALSFFIKKEDPKTILLLWEGEVWREVCKSLFLSDLKKFSPHLSWEEFLTHFTQLEEKIGKRYSGYLLSQRNFLSSELAAKLVSKGLCPKSAQAVVQYCCEQGFLNDEEAVQRLIAKNLRKGISAKALFYKLKAKKGIDEALLRKHLSDLALPDSNTLQIWLGKNAHKMDRSDPHAMKKLMAKLCRKGFSYELVRVALRDI